MGFVGICSFNCGFLVIGYLIVWLWVGFVGGGLLANLWVWGLFLGSWVLRVFAVGCFNVFSFEVFVVLGVMLFVFCVWLILM